ncbi:aa3-type cytochrome c oxidase subunit IV [Aquisalinus flavus]|uniref:Uncharacterized protein n=1 Tax=Aquisalinus flavus TaxID=1526572 RepID=A0A8J2Y4M3_9PROT|nr:aa3-type cytochrome c oxidase subunit IV [Aquisalinus flavus]MBD0426962.1 aa3-type cytochrome c oxidase subunit IV [Aquisalinus flavus]UNE46799.1 aa3-type cytochrome c oxidase subunit IV [Aquisalinus flavus]GGC97280.1 hypothetical protein GCM10011342_02750 [Aquisalinus flavus]
MADNDYVRGSMDVSDQKTTYSALMKYGMQWGAPLSLALTAFFTALLLNAGIIGGFFVFLVVLIGCHLFVKTFLSH